MKNGFTLIELLVVVLIIGILAAIALPQYRVAVTRTKMSTLLPLMRSIKDAQERFWLDNNVYTDNLELLDLQMPPGNPTSSPTTGQLNFDNDTCLDNISSPAEPSGWLVFGGLGSKCGGGNVNTCAVYLYFDHSSRPGYRTCAGTLPECARVCKSLGF